MIAVLVTAVGFLLGWHHTTLAALAGRAIELVKSKHKVKP